MVEPGRKFVKGSGKYRYGFNGKENDKDVSEGIQDYGMRIYDARLCKFLSVDPLQKDYPSLTPYQFSSNSPIANIDLDGLEQYWYNYAWDKSKGFTLLSHGVVTNNPTWWEENVAMNHDPEQNSGKKIIGVTRFYGVNGKNFTTLKGMVNAGLSGELDNNSISQDKLNEVIILGALIIGAEITENAMENSATGHSLDAFIAGGELMSAEKLLIKNSTKGEAEVINKPTERIHGGTPEASKSNTAKQKNRNANDAFGDNILYNVHADGQNQGQLLKIGKGKGDDLNAAGDPKRMLVSEKKAREAGYPNARATIRKKLGTTTTKQATDAEATEVKKERANGNALPLNKERAKKYKG